VIGPSGAVRVMLATRPVDFRKGMDGLAMLVREQLGADPFCGTVFAFRSRRADRLKLLFFDGTGVVLVAKRLEAGAFRWPKPGDGALRLTAAEMAALVDGLDWRRVHVPRETVVPRLAG
jgi:transposase